MPFCSIFHYILFSDGFRKAILWLFFSPFSSLLKKREEEKEKLISKNRDQESCLSAQSFIIYYFQMVSAWIGYNRRSTSDWVWSDKSSGYKYSNWFKEPTEDDTQKCSKIASAQTDGMWRRFDCTQKSGYICKVRFIMN